ncbi:MAG: VOC family protein [Magnetococcales bacterium]|nr:VOC family protein [Magnetococcales bacterium]
MTDMKISHVGYVVPRMDTAIKRFVKEGGELLIPATIDPIQNVSIALIAMTNDFNVELVAPLSKGDSPLAGRLTRQGGLDHICFKVKSLKEALKGEVKAGSLIVCQPTYAVAFDADIAFVHRRSGMVVEFMAFREGSKHDYGNDE